MFGLKIRSIAVIFAASGFLATPHLLAQDTYHLLTFGVGGGFTTQTGRISSHLDNGGNLQVSGGVNLGILSLNGTFTFNAMGLTRSTLSQINVPDGYAHVSTFTIDPKLRIPLGRASFYAVGGGGWMRRTVTFTQPVLVQTIVFDPWWGYFGPALVPAKQSLGSVIDNSGVWDIGGGFDFLLPRTTWKLFVEARYFDGMTSQAHTTIVPISVGVRW
jgi:hypothetical protein